jgi:hypothetical protein
MMVYDEVVVGWAEIVITGPKRLVLVDSVSALGFRVAERRARNVQSVYPPSMMALVLWLTELLVCALVQPEVR